ncbi:MAG: AI-2E family transporter [Halobacteriovoraceae bacterium]|jgi:putative permease|nr:AI-2E family transporter [Halobacteriovoraceae bacterium]
MFFFLITVVSMLAIFTSLSRIMIPFGFAYILSLMLKPIQKSFYSVELRKKGLSLLMLVGIAFVFSYPIIQGVKTVTEESHKIEYYLPKLEKYLREKYVSIQQEVKQRFNYEIKANPVNSLIEFGQENTKQLVIFLPKIIGSLLEWGIMIPLFLFFILKDERRVRFLFIKIVPNSIVERAYYLYHQFNTKFGDYIFAKAIEALIIGVIITTGLLIIGYPFAFLLGLLAAITNILPYAGPFLGFIPALIVGLVDQNPNTTLGAMIILYLVANIIDLALVFPVLVSKIVNLHPIVVVVSVILGSQFGGIVGMVISIPMAAFFKLLYQEIYLELYGKA